MNGIDVSHWQGTIDWDAVVNSNSELRISFAYIKCSEGNKFVDPCFVKNWGACLRLKIPRGAYHWLKADKDPRKQAELFCGLAIGGDLPPMLDVEENCGKRKGEMENIILKFLDRCDELGLHCGIYTSAAKWNKFLPRTDWAKKRLLWVAHWNRWIPLPIVPWDWRLKGWGFWQWANKGKVLGIRGNVDLNRCNEKMVAKFMRTGVARVAEVQARALAR